ncbi:MAG: AAA family ATPase [Oscillospiraceae bacterium]|nr:AAA family ATPase [Oscillospiraceae bacterium]
MAVRPYIGAVKLTGELAQGSYLTELPVIQYLAQAGQLELTKPVTFFAGENGTGKSTLLEAIAVAYGFNPEGGTKNFNFSTEDSHSELWQALTLVKRGYASDGFFLRAESFYNVASNIDRMDREPSFGGRVVDSYGGVSLHHRSHGESFLALVQNRFGGQGVYLLDEPEAALSPTRQLTLLAQIDELVKEDSQFIIATHSPILMAYPGAEILEFSEKGIRSVAYRETEHYQVTRRFLEDPERMLRYLLEE